MRYLQHTQDSMLTFFSCNDLCTVEYLDSGFVGGHKIYIWLCVYTSWWSYSWKSVIQNLLHVRKPQFMPFGRRTSF